jgi:orotidine-5'-phosphate decarboxylase
MDWRVNLGPDRPVSLFLDAKLFDTADTVCVAARNAFDIGARFLTVHPTPSVIRAALSRKDAYMRGVSRQKVLTIPLLSDQARGPGYQSLVTNALYEGVDGIVCAPTDVEIVATLREKTGCRDAIILCAGVRPSGNETHGHVRHGTPSSAIKAGADYIIVGRPIMQSPDPIAAARDIVADILSVE